MLPSNISQPTLLTLTAFGKLGKFTIAPADVVYLKGDSNYTHIYFASGRRVLSARTLAVFENMTGFIRTHRCYLINAAYIESLCVIHAKKAFVVLKSGLLLAVSRRRIAYVAEQISRLKEN